MFVFASIFSLTSSKAARIQTAPRPERHSAANDLSTGVLIVGSILIVILFNRAGRFVKYP
jgi:hypothetical protein